MVKKKTKNKTKQLNKSLFALHDKQKNRLPGTELRSGQTETETKGFSPLSHPASVSGEAS